LPTYTRRRVLVPTTYNPKNFEDLKELAKEFEFYWLNGYSEEFGKDAPLDRPKTVLDAGISHVHFLFVDDISEADEKKWRRNNRAELAPMFRASSDSMMVYAVSEQGTAVLLAVYLEDGHKSLNDQFNMSRLAHIALKVFRDEGEEPMLPNDLMNLLRTPTH
jgi:hypothetical protein